MAVVGVDRKTDAALLRLIGSGLFAHAVLGDWDEMRVGARVLVIGVDTIWWRNRQAIGARP